MNILYTECYRREAATIVDIFIGIEKISCTTEHPFWVEGKGWVLAFQLKRGMALRTYKGESLVIDEIRRRTEVTQVFNVEIEGQHTYFVSNLEILSHNMCGGVSKGSNDTITDPSRLLPASGETSSPFNGPLGRGSTGRTDPINLSEQLAMEQAISQPSRGRPLPLTMTDPRWPASEGWVKKAQNINGIEIHYVENLITGRIDDFKFPK